MNEHTSEVPVDDDEPIEITLGDTDDIDQYPGVPELWQEISQKPIDAHKIAELRLRYYPTFSDEQIVLIEQSIEYSFRKFQLHASWARFSETRQPGIEEYGCTTHSSLSDRLQVLSLINQAPGLDAAFATLGLVEQFLAISGDPSLVDRVSQCLDARGTCVVADIGCGGQIADIQLLTRPEFMAKELKVLGIGAYDYGEKLRSGFPELADRLAFQSHSIYQSDFPETADLVFSVRTLAYTGVVDVARFFDAAIAQCKPSGAVWIECIDEVCFDFSGSKYESFGHYLSSLGEKMPSLRYRNIGSTSYAVYWQKSEGSPLADLVAKQLVLNERQRVHLLKYGVISSDTIL